jgi:hypothetical protein
METRSDAKGRVSTALSNPLILNALAGRMSTQQMSKVATTSKAFSRAAFRSREDRMKQFRDLVKQLARLKSDMRALKRTAAAAKAASVAASDEFKGILGPLFKDCSKQQIEMIASALQHPEVLPSLRRMELLRIKRNGGFPNGIAVFFPGVRMTRAPNPSYARKLADDEISRCCDLVIDILGVYPVGGDRLTLPQIDALEALHPVWRSRAIEVLRSRDAYLTIQDKLNDKADDDYDLYLRLLRASDDLGIGEKRLQTQIRDFRKFKLSKLPKKFSRLGLSRDQWNRLPRPHTKWVLDWKRKYDNAMQ